MSDKHKTRKDSTRRDLFLVGILILICLILFGIGSLASSEIQRFSIMGLSNSNGEGTKVSVAVLVTATTAPSKTPKPSVQPQKDKTGESSDRSQGLGVSREEMQKAYEEEKFTFSSNQGNENNVNLMGQSANKITGISLNGPTNNLTKIVIVATIVKNNSETLQTTLGYMTKLIKLLAPEWKDGTKWLYASLAKLATSDQAMRQESITYRGLKVILKLTNSPDLVFLTCEAEEKSTK